MTKRISITLNASSINAAINELKRYEAWVERASKKITERLMEIGIQEASIRFANAIYDGVNDSSLDAKPIANGWRIEASGNAVCFIEFGTGVFYNGSGSYPMNKPEGIVGIGQYGKGQGKRQGWTYQGEPGTNGRVINVADNRVFTHGNPAAMPFYYATKEMKDKLLDIAREVLRND